MQGKLKIAESDFWSDDPIRDRDSIDDPLLAAKTEALIADAPRKVPLDVRTTMPVVALRVVRTQTALAAPVEKFAIVVLRDQETGRVRAATAIPPPDRRVSKQEPEEADPTSMTSEEVLSDLRARLDVPWRPGRFRAALIVRELISEDLEISLEAGGGYKDDAVEKHRHDEAMKAPLPDVSPALQPGKPVPAYGSVEGAPALPQKPGLILAAERVMKQHGKEPLVVKGSFRVQVPEWMLASGERGQKAADQSGGQRPGALVPISLVITASTRPAPYVFSLVVPSFEVDPKTRIAAGRFAVDLDAAGPLRAVEQTLFIYGFAGAERFGPLPIALAGE